MSVSLTSCVHMLDYRRYLLSIIILLGLIIGPGTSSAAVYFVNSCNDKSIASACGLNNGVKLIYIFGKIDALSASKIRQYAASLSDDTPFPPVYLNSPGGSITSAIEIGRILRSKSASVFEKDILFPNKASGCSSACVMVAAGAKFRNMASISLHKGSIIKRLMGHKYQSFRMDNEGLEKIYAYYDEMGINPDIKHIIGNTPENGWNNIEIDKDITFESQDIVKLGFLMDKNVFMSEVLNSEKREIADINGAEALIYLADRNDVESARSLGERFIHGLDGEQQNTQKGLYYLNKAGDLGDAHSLHQLGVYYNIGFKDIKQEKMKAFDYFLRSANLGFAGSQNNVAWHYYKGEGVDKSLSEAIFWVTRAVEQGDAFGYSTLSTIRFEENGFVKDDVETYKWTLLACKKLPEGTSKKDQLEQLIKLTARMTKEKIEKAKKLALEWKPLKNTTVTLRDKDDL